VIRPDDKDTHRWWIGAVLIMLALFLIARSVAEPSTNTVGLTAQEMEKVRPRSGWQDAMTVMALITEDCRMILPRSAEPKAILLCLEDKLGEYLSGNSEIELHESEKEPK